MVVGVRVGVLVEFAGEEGWISVCAFVGWNDRRCVVL